MYLVIADSQDASAVWAYEKMKSHLGAPVEFVLLDEFVTAPHISWRFEGGTVQSRLELHTGLTIDSSCVQGILNRCREPRSPIEGEGAKFSQQEIRACLLCWLAGFDCPVVNSVDALAMHGTDFDLHGWKVQAKRSGLQIWEDEKCPGEGFNTQQKISKLLVINGRCLGEEVDGDIARKLVHLCNRCGLNFMEVWMCDSKDRGLQFAGASSFADLSIGGEDTIDEFRKIFSSNVVSQSRVES